MPGPIEPNWGIPQEFAALASNAVYDRTSGGLRCEDSHVPMATLIRRSDTGAVEWRLTGDLTLPMSPPAFPIEDNQTINILTHGLFQTAQGTVVYAGIPYNLSIQRSHVSARMIAVAIPA